MGVRLFGARRSLAVINNVSLLSKCVCRLIAPKINAVELRCQTVRLQGGVCVCYFYDHSVKQEKCTEFVGKK